MKKNKQYFVYYLQDNILIFDVFDFIEELASDFVDYAMEWYLVKDNKVIVKHKMLKQFVQIQTTKYTDWMLKFAKNKNCKMLCVYQPNKNKFLNQWCEFFADPNEIIKFLEKQVKKYLPNFIINDKDVLFSLTIGKFDDIPCLNPTGEDMDFLKKVKKKLK